MRVLLQAAIALTLILPGIPPASAQTAASVTTKLALDKCRHTAGKEEEDYGEWRCTGLAGIAVYVSAGDQRTYVSYGPNAKREPAAKETLASFNGEGAEIEWRGKRDSAGKFSPIATIMRWSTTVSSEDEPVRGEMLVVTRLAPGRVCHIGYIDAKANPDAVALARDLADAKASGFRCGADKPVVVGKRGPGFSGPYGN